MNFLPYFHLNNTGRSSETWNAETYLDLRFISTKIPRRYVSRPKIICLLAAQWNSSDTTIAIDKRHNTRPLPFSTRTWTPPTPRKKQREPFPKLRAFANPVPAVIFGIPNQWEIAAISRMTSFKQRKECPVRIISRYIEDPNPGVKNYVNN